MKNVLFTLIVLAYSAAVVAQNNAVFTVKADKPTAEISPNMWGIFFEDINMGADGGIYAELVKNRSFEFFKPMMGWEVKGGKNYFVVETEAQGFPQWTPYPNQLRLQAFSHLASGANMVGYWHWHSIHNSAETYWKGLLSHDFEPNPTYLEAQTIGKDFNRLSDKLINLKKNNDVAILFSNEALSAFNTFSFGWGAREKYNDMLRPYYDALYNMNVGTDFIDPSVNFGFRIGDVGNAASKMKHAHLNTK